VSVCLADLNLIWAWTLIRGELLNLAYLQAANEREHFFSSRRHCQRLTLEYGKWRVGQALPKEHQASRGVIPARTIRNSFGVGPLPVGRLCPGPCFPIARRKAVDQLGTREAQCGKIRGMKADAIKGIGKLNLSQVIELKLGDVELARR
jgi:hypothetical protein